MSPAVTKAAFKADTRKRIKDKAAFSAKKKIYDPYARQKTPQPTKPISGLKDTITRLGITGVTMWAKRIAWGTVIAPEPISTAIGIAYLNFHLLASLWSDNFKMGILEIIGVVLVDIVIGLLLLVGLSPLILQAMILQDPERFVDLLGEAFVNYITGSF